MYSYLIVNFEVSLVQAISVKITTNRLTSQIILYNEIEFPLAHVMNYWYIEHCLSSDYYGALIRVPLWRIWVF